MRRSCFSQRWPRASRHTGICSSIDVPHGSELNHADNLIQVGDDIKHFAEGALLDVASKLVCRVIVPGVMGVAEVAEDAVPVGGEIADAAEIGAEPGIIAACQKGMDKVSRHTHSFTCEMQCYSLESPSCNAANNTNSAKASAEFMSERNLR